MAFLDGWVRRLALEVGRGTNITIAGTKFAVSEHMLVCLFVLVTILLSGSHVAAVAVHPRALSYLSFENLVMFL